MAKGETQGVSEARVRELILEAVKGLELVSEERVQILIVESEEGIGKQLVKLLTKEQGLELLKGAVTEERVIEIVAGQLDQFFPVSTDEAAPELDPAWLKGLTFVSSTRREATQPGGRDQHVPSRRPLAPTDVLSWSFGPQGLDGAEPDSVILVCKDGNKHTVQL